MRRLACLILLLALSSCTGDDDPPSTADYTGAISDGGACDAAPVDGCGDCGVDEVCVHYDSLSGFTSCTDYSACVPTTETCAPGSCTPECETALCPDPYTCDPTATDRFTCTKP